MEEQRHISVRDSLLGEASPYISEAIPKELRSRPQWVVHRQKVPFDPKTGRSASPTDLTTWGTFSEALERLKAGGYDGLGFVFCSADPFSGIDLDKCRNPETGELTPEASAIVHHLEGYAEVSPSGTGVHIIVRGKLPESKRRGWIEAYSQGRYFTVTGKAL